MAAPDSSQPFTGCTLPWPAVRATVRKTSTRVASGPKGRARSADRDRKGSSSGPPRGRAASGMKELMPPVSKSRHCSQRRLGRWSHAVQHLPGSTAVHVIVERENLVVATRHRRPRIESTKRLDHFQGRCVWREYRHYPGWIRGPLKNTVQPGAHLRTPSIGRQQLCAFIGDLRTQEMPQSNSSGQSPSDVNQGAVAHAQNGPQRRIQVVPDQGREGAYWPSLV